MTTRQAVVLGQPGEQAGGTLGQEDQSRAQERGGKHSDDRSPPRERPPARAEGRQVLGSGVQRISLVDHSGLALARAWRFAGIAYVFSSACGPDGTKSDRPRVAFDDEHLEAFPALVDLVSGEDGRESIRPSSVLVEL